MKIHNYDSTRFTSMTVLTTVGYGMDSQQRFCVWVMQAAPSVFVIRMQAAPSRMQSCTPEDVMNWWQMVCKQYGKKPIKRFAFFLNDCQERDEIRIIEDITYQKLQDIIRLTVPGCYVWMNV